MEISVLVKWFCFVVFLGLSSGIRVHGNEVGGREWIIVEREGTSLPVKFMHLNFIMEVALLSSFSRTSIGVLS